MNAMIINRYLYFPKRKIYTNLAHEIPSSTSTSPSHPLFPALQTLAIPIVKVNAAGPRHTRVAAIPAIPATLRILGLRGILRQREDALAGPLGRHHDQRRRVRRHHAREDRRVDHEQVVRAVHLGVDVDHRRAAHAPVVSPDVGRADPVVRAAVAGGHDHLLAVSKASGAQEGSAYVIDKVGGAGAWGRVHPGQVRDIAQGGLDVLDALDHSSDIVRVVEIRRG